MARVASSKTKKPKTKAKAKTAAKSSPTRSSPTKSSPAKSSAAKSSAAKSAVAKSTLRGKPATKSKSKTKSSPKARPKKNRNVKLFVMEPEKPRAPEPLAARLAPWPCSHANARRTGATSLAYAPPVALAWEAKLPGAPRTAPVVADDGSLYAADADGNLVALDSATGRELWRFHTDPVAPTSPARPLVDEGVVPGDRVPVAAPPCVSDWRLFFGDDEGVVYGLRRGDATLVLRHVVPLSLAARSQSAFAAPLVAGGIVYAADSDGTLHAISTDGPALWSRVLRGRVSVPPALVAHHVLVATHPLFPNEPPELHALEAGTGDRQWHRPLPGLPRALVALEDAALVLAGDQLVRLELGTGATLAHRTFPLEEAPGSLATDGALVYATIAGGLVALDARTLDERWRARTKRPVAIVGAPAVAREHVWLAAREGLIALEKKSGREVARVRTRGVPATGVVLAAGKLFVATEPNRILAFE